MNKKSKLTIVVTSILVILLANVVILELILSFFPVNEGLHAQETTYKNNVFRFEKNRTSVWSRGWNFDIVNTVHTNNDGFVNNKPYYKNGDKPLIAIIGDSYIEAAMVPFDNTVTGRLQEYLKEKYRVYSFAASGAGLAQYTRWMSYASDKYSPEKYIFNIIGNDFRESLWSLERNPGFYGFDRDDKLDYKMLLKEYKPSIIRRIFRHSSLVMYLMTNVKITQFLNIKELLSNFLSDGARWDERYVGNIVRKSSKEVFAEQIWAIDQFFKQINKTKANKKDITFVLDGFRPHMYSMSGKYNDYLTSEWGLLRKYFSDKAKEAGHKVVDLHVYFLEDYKINQKHFESKTDTHWNGYGHKIVTNALIDTIQL